MKHARTTLNSVLRLLALTTTCISLAAQADDYGDVSQLLRAGKLSEAQSKVDVYLVSKPGDPQMRFLKGVIQRNSGKQAEAIATFTKLTEDYPELPEPYNNLAVLYAGQNQFDKARTALEMAIRTNPSYATAHENLGDVYARLASQAYNKALQLDGANAAVPPKLALIRELFKPNIKTPAAAPATPAATSPGAEPAKPPATVPVPVAVTPAAASTSVAAPVPAAAKPDVNHNAGNDSKQIEGAVRAWAKAWSSKDLAAYLSAYGKEFTPAAKQSRSAWEDERRKRIAGKSSISVKLENLSVTVKGNTAIVKFRQDYRADALSISSRKTLDLLKAGDKWLIIRETTGN